jgi:hypothetical protein
MKGFQLIKPTCSSVAWRGNNNLVCWPSSLSCTSASELDLAAWILPSEFDPTADLVPSDWPALPESCCSTGLWDIRRSCFVFLLQLLSYLAAVNNFSCAPTTTFGCPPSLFRTREGTCQGTNEKTAQLERELQEEIVKANPHLYTMQILSQISSI